MTTNTKPWTISKSFSRSQQDWIEFALEIAFDELDLDGLREPLTIMSRHGEVLSSTPIQGSCWTWNGFGYIQLNRDLYNTELAFTLFHEMKHIEQLLTRRLISMPGYRFWQGKLYRTSPEALGRMSLRKYNQLPWEAEANAYEGKFRKSIE